MAILQNATTVRVAGSAVTAVYAGTRKVWPSRKIIGYKVGAAVTSRARYIDQVATLNGEETKLAPYVGMRDLRIRARGSAASLPVSSISAEAPYGIIEVQGNVIQIGIKNRTVVELLVPVYG
ncbi:hypothetical protein [Corynebacterium lactis]|uniref:Uncharacterized protein n=1 Tax=Corynebacterium lactis RW2-5 TaxID=1408189 RepID=A0A0K2H3C9_9CORY|nr:hypothetical protein [Corynebacterium lactis]ALA68544.1 hypothetical protein CLAC_07255 [Corynebacterium lactis RW2-5]